MGTLMISSMVVVDAASVVGIKDQRVITDTSRGQVPSKRGMRESLGLGPLDFCDHARVGED